MFGSVNPTASKSEKRPFASARPAKSPTIDASVPMTSASSMTERSTCDRDAPSVRSVANSRMRCAIVIEREFAITKLPTKSATPPKPSRNFCRKEMKESVSLLSSRDWACAVRACASAGRTPRTSLINVWSETPWSAATAISSSCPSLPNRRCAVGRSKPDKVAPPIVDTEPNLTKPETRSR